MGGPHDDGQALLERRRAEHRAKTLSGSDSMKPTSSESQSERCPNCFGRGVIRQRDGQGLCSECWWKEDTRGIIIRRLLERGGLMKGKAALMSFQTFDRTEKRHSTGYDEVCSWLKHYPHDEGESMYLWSKGYGAGKTHLARATQRWIIQAGGRVLFRVLPEVLTDIRESYRPDSELGQAAIIHRMQAADTLILDDLGRGHVRDSSKGWLADIMYLIINARHDASLSMFITSNVGPNEIRDVIGGASTSRLMEMVDTRICDMSGRDWRMRK